MGFIINDAKKNGVIKTSPAEAIHEETTSEIYVGESNNERKNGEQCLDGKGLVPLSDGETPGGEKPAVESEGYVMTSHDNEKEQPCDVNSGEHAQWNGNKGIQRDASMDEIEVSNREGEQSFSSHNMLNMANPVNPVDTLMRLREPPVSHSNLIHPTNFPIQQHTCYNGSDINAKMERNDEGKIQSLKSGNGDLINTNEGCVNSDYQRNRSDVSFFPGPHQQGQVEPTEHPNMLISTMDQKQSSFSFQSTLMNPDECVLTAKDGGGGESIATTNGQTWICSAAVNTSYGGEEGVAVMPHTALENNAPELNQASGMITPGEVSRELTGHLGEESPRRKYPSSSDRKPPSSANSDDDDESNKMIKKKIKKKVDENDELFYAINEFMKDGLKNECIPLFERLQQNLFFLVMLANIPNDNFDEQDSSSSDY
ncbi:conserved Plasmodium protein, unknown function [Plasmodium knowlesi strain H]|uniref:SS18 N-terminal domain-containing protein n=3 Tax=Plasmodium knowlesi TaxID=5850 RepID=A0A5K1U0A1_PLAKH|nr:conserved Plasmodium protein, unknown function [Plasmodium knowlesi strain H]OTN66154.1 Uncharacterized protein PKNOH_S09528100 [Plasmodium knowlesi]CAA9990026.1 conserved Plasmodium protein, unknown function [Plasmodium knowlesi strain H]SBO24630.1 conserved Plasmodium protein, unknown function [Plasmodium knowlesi strain H]SBO26182.1 conserved Plasmodium protein, unknown function [Plasmodium knowlesi strain H]VVS79500.1 conserved Plasmodium protein, unknown function [Plasmodium knowlesi s|eukprot:XP_002260041.1 hypothetical protein, conserved in Plasmodium species [Plasmodium knowlesi strain H]